MLVFSTIIRKEQGGRTREFVRAICDDCGAEFEIRKDWAHTRFKERGKTYVCKTCSASKNLIAARAELNQMGLEDSFIDLCFKIKELEYDDKATEYICAHLGRKDYYLVTLARDFTATIVSGTENVSNEVVQAANYLEDGQGEMVSSLYEIETILCAQALIAFGM